MGNNVDIVHNKNKIQIKEKIMKVNGNMLSKTRILSGYSLKCIAMLSMLIDHTGAILFPECLFLRIIGRLAFPIYCFLLVEGAMHTSNEIKYLGRLFLFALISEIPFDLAFFGTFLYSGAQNVFWTLFFGLAAIVLIKRYPKLWFLFFIFPVLAEWMRTDYGAIGVFFILLFYFLYDRFYYKQLSFALVNTVAFLGEVQMYAGLAAILLMLYNGRRGRKAGYFFYIFYPLHLLLLHFLSIYIMR